MILVLLGICVIMIALSVILLINDILDDEICLCGIVAFGFIFFVLRCGVDLSLKTCCRGEICKR